MSQETAQTTDLNFIQRLKQRFAQWKANRLLKKQTVLALKAQVVLLEKRVEQLESASLTMLKRLIQLDAPSLELPAKDGTKASTNKVVVLKPKQAQKRKSISDALGLLAPEEEPTYH